MVNGSNGSVVVGVGVVVVVVVVVESAASTTTAMVRRAAKAPMKNRVEKVFMAADEDEDVDHESRPNTMGRRQEDDTEECL